MSTNPLQVSNQMDIFVCSEMLKPASVPVGLGTQSKIGAVDVPVILDESFAFYDENRLKETLKWLAENRTQVLLFTCQKREEEALSEMGIPHRKIVL